MIFNGYENYLLEEIIDLGLYVAQDGSTEEFHQKFFKEERGSFLDGFNIGSVFSVFSQKDQTETDGLIERLQGEGVNHVLLIMSQTFITETMNEQRKLLRAKNKKAKIKPREFAREFMDKFISEFEKSDITCSVVIDGSRSKSNIDTLESWLDMTALIKSLGLNSNEAYMLGFKDMSVESEHDDSLLFVQMGQKTLTIKSGCSILMGDNKMLRFNTMWDESILKITNNSKDIDSFIDIITENIDDLHSNNKALQEEYFDHEIFEEFSVSYRDLKSDDIDFSIGKHTIMLSTTQLQQSSRENPRKNTIPDREKRPTSTIPSDTNTIGTDTDIPSSSAFVNFKNRYLVNLKSFLVPYEDDLTEVHYHLIRVNNKPILVGASQMDRTRQPIAKVVADISKGAFVVTNLQTKPISFVIRSDKVEYKITKTIPKPMHNYIDTDGAELSTESDEIILQKGESHEFVNKIEFNSSSIAYTQSGVAIEYIHFTIGSFNNKLEFGRRYYSHFATGNIIDAKESLESAGRIYADGSHKILGSLLSSQPFILRLVDESFTLLNDIKPHYAVRLQTPSMNQTLEYGQELTVSKDDLLTNPNTLAITRDGLSLVEISIIPN